MVFTFDCLLDQEDGTPAEPPTLRPAVPNWQVGDTIALGADKMLRVIEIRPGSNADDNRVLVVEHRLGVGETL